jgi:hypothetical protein
MARHSLKLAGSPLHFRAFFEVRPHVISRHPFVFLSAPERTMRASSQRREAADLDDPLMALVNVVRELRGDDQRTRTERWLVFSALH